MEFTRDNITVTEFAAFENGSKHFQVTYKNGSFTHISVLPFVPRERQSEDILYAMAVQRVGNAR